MRFHCGHIFTENYIPIKLKRCIRSYNTKYKHHRDSHCRSNIHFIITFIYSRRRRWTVETYKPNYIHSQNLRDWTIFIPPASPPLVYINKYWRKLFSVNQNIILNWYARESHLCLHPPRFSRYILSIYILLMRWRHERVSMFYQIRARPFKKKKTMCTTQTTTHLFTAYICGVSSSEQVIEENARGKRSSILMYIKHPRTHKRFGKFKSPALFNNIYE